MRKILIASGLAVVVGALVFVGVACSKSTDAATTQSGVTAANTGSTPAGPNSAQPAGSAAPSDSGTPMGVKLPTTISIATNTQAELDDVRIGCGNFWEDEYTDASGAKKKGMTAMLWVYTKGAPEKDQKLRVFPGFKFTASKMAFEVSSVADNKVELKVVAAGGAAQSPAPKG